MFKSIGSREQEVALLKFAKLEAQCNKYNIQEAKKLEPVYKSNGEIHKTKMKQKDTIINGWIKEQKKLKQFFIEHQHKGSTNDWKRYKYKTGVTDNRTGVEDLFKSGDQ